MINLGFKITLLITVFAFWSVGHPLAVPAQTQEESSFRISSDKKYGDDKFWNEYSAMALEKNGEILIAASTRNAPDAKDSNVNRLLLWRINQTGEITGETEIKNPKASGTALKGGVTTAIKDLVVLENGDALLVVDFESASPSIVRVTKTGKQALVKGLTGPGRSVTLFKIVPTLDGSFLLFGHESLDALMMKVDAVGNILWEKKQDLGKMDLFVDGIATADGCFILVANSGEYNALRGGPSVVWVGQYDANGGLKAELSFKGRYGKVARSKEGGYTLVYDKGDAEGQDIRLKSLGPDLRESGESPLLTLTPSFLDFKIAAVEGGGCIIAGGKTGKPYLARVDAKGKIVGVFQGDATTTLTNIGNYGLIYQSGEIVVVCSTILIIDKTNVTQKVRIMRMNL